MKKATTIILQILALVVLLQGLVLAQAKGTYWTFINLDKIFGTTLLPASAVSLKSNIIEYDNSISEPNTTFEGYLAFGSNASVATRPSILLIPGVGGITPAVKAKADELAKLRRLVLVVDLFGKGAKAGADEIAALKAKPALARGRIAAALNCLEHQAKADSKRLSVIGFDEGGYFALEAARSGLPLKFVAAVDPTDLTTTARATKDGFKGSILVIHSQSPQISQQVADLTNEMKAANVDLVTFNVGVPPGFRKPAGETYNVKAEARAEELLSSYLKEKFFVPGSLDVEM